MAKQQKWKAHNIARSCYKFSYADLIFQLAGVGDNSEQLKRRNPLRLARLKRVFHLWGGFDPACGAPAFAKAAKEEQQHVPARPPFLFHFV